MNARVVESREEVVGEDASIYAGIARRMKWWMHRPFARDILAQGLSSGCVLDVGCGPGYLATYLAAYAPAVKVWALDISSDMLARVRENAAARGLGARIIPVEGDIKALPFPAQCFDMVVSTFALHHLADLGQGVDEMLRVLKPGGMIMVKDLIRPSSLRRSRLLVDIFGGILGYDAAAKRQYFDSLQAGFSREEAQSVASARQLDVRFLPLSCFQLIRRPQPDAFALPVGDVPEGMWRLGSDGLNRGCAV